MLKASHQLAAGLKRIGFAQWASEVHWYANLREGKVTTGLCSWSCTIRTHKPAESLVCRPIHAATNHCFPALGEVVNRLLSVELKLFPHLCFSCEVFLMHLRKTQITSRSIFMKFDVKDFYLSDSHEDLFSRSSRL